MQLLSDATLGKAYTIEEICVKDETTKKSLNQLGMIPGGQVAVTQFAGENGIILLHNSRIALDKSILKQIHITEKEQINLNWMPLSQLKIGEYAKVVGIHGEGTVKRRLMDMGLTKNVEIFARKVAPFGDPIEINLRGYELTLRKSEAELVLVAKEEKN